MPGVALLVAALLGLPGVAGAARPACGDGRWAIPGDSLFGGVARDADLLELHAGTLAVASGCGPTTARVRRAGRTTRVRAEWPDCAGKRARLLAALRGTGCSELHGRLLRGRHRVRFTGVRIAPRDLDVVPLPAVMDVGSPDEAFVRGAARAGSAGGAFLLGRRTRILASGREAAAAAASLHALVAPHVRGLRLVTTTTARPRRHAILLAVDATAADLGPEGYRLLVTPAAVSLRAATAVGLQHGVQTLRQLLPPEVERRDPVPGLRLGLPVVRIADAPRFRWRGLLFDVSRTFFPIGFVSRLIDLAALYKLDVVHLHLTDDQGWRFESRTHPALHERGSVWDPVRAPGERSGYYTQDELRALVAKAAALGITLVPEIDMPGHALAALHAMPELACTTAPGIVRSPDEFPLVPYHLGPPIHPEILCAGREQVYAVLEDVLGELLDVFPSPWIHLGGDEVPKTEWETSYECQALIAREGLSGTEHLQAWFTKRLETFLRGRGRRMMGWEEILDAQAAGDAQTRLADDTVVMRWRGILADPPDLYDRDVVFAPFPPLYFDYQWSGGLELAYGVEPVPPGLEPAKAARVLGVQANMWTGFPSGRTEAGVDEHVFPRLLALAEVGWTPRARRDLARFRQRVQAQTARLDALGVARAP